MRAKEDTHVSLSDLPPVKPLDRTAEPALRARVDGKAKPPGSLGRIEDLAVRLGLMWQPEAPRAERTVLFLFAGDHGLTAEGVSSYPSSVTAAMVRTFLAGRASINAFAAATNVEVRIVDAGVAADLPPHPNLIVAKIRRGTRNAARASASAPDRTKPVCAASAKRLRVLPAVRRRARRSTCSRSLAAAKSA